MGGWVGGCWENCAHPKSRSPNHCFLCNGHRVSAEARGRREGEESGPASVEALHRRLLWKPAPLPHRHARRCLVIDDDSSNEESGPAAVEALHRRVLWTPRPQPHRHARRCLVVDEDSSSEEGGPAAVEPAVETPMPQPLPSDDEDGFWI